LISHGRQNEDDLEVVLSGKGGLWGRPPAIIKTLRKGIDYGSERNGSDGLVGCPALGDAGAEKNSLGGK
jgi:hypothetical protein